MKKMTAQEVASKIIYGELLFILDVRNEEDYAKWRIEGKRVTSVNIPYFDLLDGVEHARDQLPQDERDIVVVCAKEGSSRFVAEQLEEAGLKEVYYLEGGMKTWSETIFPVKIGDLTGGGSIYQFNRIGKGCLSYLIESQGEAVVIDAGRLTDVFEQFALEKGFTIHHVLDTHLHADHISGGRALSEKVGATYYLPPRDAEEVTYSYEPLLEGETIQVGQARIRIQSLYSPGHTIGSTSFIVDDQYLLSGDILFVDSIGRPDLAGKAEDWVRDLRETLYERYSALSSELIVLPAHYSKISEMGDEGRVFAKLGELYQSNAGLQVANQEVFRKMVTDNLPPQPHAYQEVRQTNMGKMTPSAEEQREMEMGPNRCAVHDSSESRRK
ncbi:MBL fold metallo-hydrolase [Marininema halotolerans]|uniref:Glyoxylase, beta-lactamase superfamily II n=1 Tax=Marininema halotolerans TaxID=1155944 RepID=A0A1I6RX46_9BACL|nr:MBL fold metallo-hydrolase [Marininema halotolerans]SFS69160.1 Glyoxylase, beta-lactamase superfamily II [Marininema halotolerans]